MEKMSENVLVFFCSSMKDQRLLGHALQREQRSKMRIPSGKLFWLAITVLGESISRQAKLSLWMAFHGKTRSNPSSETLHMEGQQHKEHPTLLVVIVVTVAWEWHRLRTIK
jgi:hypothetical protein